MPASASATAAADSNNSNDDVTCVAGNPPSLGKVEGQVPVSQPYDGLFEQEDMNLPLSQIGVHAINEPEASNGPEAKNRHWIAQVPER